MISGGALGLTAFLLLTVVHSQEQCSKTCVAQTCDGYGLRYGKYCGLGYFGCPGEKPCDDLDACCMNHDKCVDEKGMTFIDCHKKLQHCVNELSEMIKQSKNKKLGFSKQCPYSTVIPTVYQGMEYGILFSGIGNLISPADAARKKAETKNALATKKRTSLKKNNKEGLKTKQGSKVSASMKQPSPS